MHLFALHLRRTVLGLRLKRIEREFVIKDDVVCEDVRHHEVKPTGATNLEEEVVDRAKEELRHLNMVGGGMGQSTH